MRYLYSILLPLLIIGGQNLMAQEGTTTEEFRYLTKGYAYQKEMGLDASKKGYDFKTVWENEAEGLEILGMYSTKENELRALLAIFSNSDKLAAPTYLCIPNSNASSEIVNEYNRTRDGAIGYENRRKLDNAMRKMVFENLGSNSEAIVFKKPEVKEYQMVESKFDTIESNYDVAKEEMVTKSPKAEIVMSPAPILVPSPEINKKGPAGPAFVNHSVAGEIENRGVKNWPEFQQKTKRKGFVNIKVCVDSKGQVSSAKFTQKGSSTLNKELISLAIENANRVVFEPNAESLSDCGILKYSFNLNR